MDASAALVAAGGVAVAIAVIVMAIVQWYPRPMSTDTPPERRRRLGPTGTPYPPGSRPGDPGSEGMAVGDGGDILPGPDPRPEPADRITPPEDGRGRPDGGR